MCGRHWSRNVYKYIDEREENGNLVWRYFNGFHWASCVCVCVCTILNRSTFVYRPQCKQSNSIVRWLADWRNGNDGDEEEENNFNWKAHAYKCSGSTFHKSYTRQKIARSSQRYKLEYEISLSQISINRSKSFECLRVVQLHHPYSYRLNSLKIKNIHIYQQLDIIAVKFDIDFAPWNFKCETKPTNQ